MLAAVAPFARAGRRVDLAASDRAARRIAFAPIMHPPAEGLPALREQLELVGEDDDAWRLRRRLSTDDGPAAELEIEGGAPEALQQALAAVDPASQFLLGPGWLLACRHTLRVGGPLRLRGALARVGPLAVEATVPIVPGYPVALRLAAREPGALALPQDLLAVLGARFSRLDPAPGGGWRASMRARGRDAERARQAGEGLALALTHLSRTLAEPPARFHVRHRGARWLASARRALPLAVCLALMGAAGTVPLLELHADSLLRMLIFMAPPLVLAFVFSLRELPRIELPPLPRALDPGAWPVTQEARE
jgi:hypothetical protein